MRAPDSASPPVTSAPEPARAELPAKLFLRSARPLWGAVARMYLPFALIGGALIFAPTGAGFWALVTLGLVGYALFPAVVQGLLAPLERRVLAATPREASALLTELRATRRVRLFAPYAWTMLQEARLHLVRGDGRAAARAFAEVSRLAGVAADPPATLQSAQAQALLLGGAPEQARELLQGLAKRQAFGPWEELHLAIAQLLQGKVRADEPRTHAEAAHQALGEHPRVLAALAVAHHRAGATEPARTALAAAEAGDTARDPLAQQLIERAQRALRPVEKAQQKRLRKQEIQAAKPTPRAATPGAAPREVRPALPAAASVVAAAPVAATVAVRSPAVARAEAEEEARKPRGKRKAKREERRAARRAAKVERRSQPARAGTSGKQTGASVTALTREPGVNSTAPTRAGAEAARPAVRVAADAGARVGGEGLARGTGPAAELATSRPPERAGAGASTDVLASGTGSVSASERPAEVSRPPERAGAGAKADVLLARETGPRDSGTSAAGLPAAGSRAPGRADAAGAGSLTHGTASQGAGTGGSGAPVAVSAATPAFGELARGTGLPDVKPAGSSAAPAGPGAAAPASADLARGTGLSGVKPAGSSAATPAPADPARWTGVSDAKGSSAARVPAPPPASALFGGAAKPATPPTRAPLPVGTFTPPPSPGARVAPVVPPTPSAPPRVAAPPSLSVPVARGPLAPPTLAPPTLTAPPVSAAPPLAPPTVPSAALGTGDEEWSSLFDEPPGPPA